MPEPNETPNTLEIENETDLHLKTQIKSGTAFPVTSEPNSPSNPPNPGGTTAPLSSPGIIGSGGN